VTDFNGNVTALRPLTDVEALDFLRSQPNGRISAKPGALGKRWNWHHKKVSGRLNTWARQGLITKRRNSIQTTDILSDQNQPAQPIEKQIVPAQQILPEIPVSNGHANGALPAISSRGANAPVPNASNEAPPNAQNYAGGEQNYAPVRRQPGIVFASYVAALSLASVSAGFSITGLTSIFVGAFWPVIAMGAALELGKLSAVALLGRGAVARPLRAALTALIAVLMGLSAVGAYGFLAKAHIGHAVEGDVAVAGKLADVDGRLEAQRAALVLQSHKTGI
jgi:hypothetical protein